MRGLTDTTLLAKGKDLLTYSNQYSLLSLIPSALLATNTATRATPIGGRVNGTTTGLGMETFK